MGLGDWIMATAEAKRVNLQTGKRVAFTNGQRIFYDEQIFKGNHRIANAPANDVVPVFDAPGRRPYIKEILEDRFVFREDFKASPGELFIERQPKQDYILIEPNTKADFKLGQNKDWGFDRWQEVANLDLPFMQTGVADKQGLAGVSRVVTNSFRDALKVLSGARLLVTTDGALHHAAAALGVPAVVIWGGVASPKNLGYDMHKNIWHGAEPCGMHSKVCDHCKRALDAVTVEEVKQAVLEAYAES